MCGRTIQTMVFNGQQSHTMHSIPLWMTCYTGKMDLCGRETSWVPPKPRISLPPHASWCEARRTQLQLLKKKKKVFNQNPITRRQIQNLTIPQVWTLQKFKITVTQSNTERYYKNLPVYTSRHFDWCYEMIVQ